jgi:hypothetical protein
MRALLILNYSYQHVLNDLGYSVLITLAVKSGAIREHFFNQGFQPIPDTNRPTIPWSSLKETAVHDESIVLEYVTDLQVVVIANKVVPLVHVDPSYLVRDDIIKKTFFYISSFKTHLPMRFLNCIEFSKSLTCLL